MPWIACIVIPGCPQYVTQRGNHRQTVFFAETDRDFNLAPRRKYFALFRIQMTGYAPLANATREILIPMLPASLARGVGRLHNDFALAINPYPSGKPIFPVTAGRAILSGR
jgi:putative transposase